MKAAEAAYYAGMSVSSFFKAVEKGEMPQGKSAIGGRYWLRADLEAAMLGAETKKHNFGQKI